MSGCGLTGSLSDNLGEGWQTLEAIDLSNNTLTGTIPVSFSSWTNLTALFFQGNCFSGSLPVGLESFDVALDNQSPRDTCLAG